MCSTSAAPSSRASPRPLWPATSCGPPTSVTRPPSSQKWRPALFELRRITAGYGATTVLRDVSLAVPDGSVVALIGANGAGKTTLLRVASGLVAPTSGTLAIDGAPVEDTTPHGLVRHGICLRPDGRGVFRSLTGRDNR